MSVKEKPTGETQRDFSAAKLSHFTSSESIDFTIARGEATVNHGQWCINTGSLELMGFSPWDWK